MSSFVKDFLYAFIAIFPMINPIAMSSVFFTVTKAASQQQRRKLALLISLYGSLLLIGCLLLGPFILRFFGLQTSDIRVAGGLVVFAIAWKMLQQPRDADTHKMASEAEIMGQAFFPLTMPVTAGAGGIAIAIALGTQTIKRNHVVLHFSAIVLAIIATFLLVYVCYRYSEAIFKLLGTTGSKVVSTMSAFILLAIGVSVTWSGLKLLILSLPGIH